MIASQLSTECEVETQLQQEEYRLQLQAKESGWSSLRRMHNNAQRQMDGLQMDFQTKQSEIMKEIEDMSARMQLIQIEASGGVA